MHSCENAKHSKRVRALQKQHCRQDLLPDAMPKPVYLLKEPLTTKLSTDTAFGMFK